MTAPRPSRLAIEFGASSSPNHPAAVALARAFRKHRMRGKGRTARHVCPVALKSDRELRTALDLLRLVSSWKSASVLVDGPSAKQSTRQSRRRKNNESFDSNNRTCPYHSRQSCHLRWDRFCRSLCGKVRLGGLTLPRNKFQYAKYEVGPGDEVVVDIVSIDEEIVDITMRLGKIEDELYATCLILSVEDASEIGALGEMLVSASRKMIERRREDQAEDAARDRAIDEVSSGKYKDEVEWETRK